MRYHRVDLDDAVHVQVYNFRHIGASLCSAERRAAPVAPGYKLERPCADFLASLGYPDDDRCTPAAVACL